MPPAGDTTQRTDLPEERASPSLTTAARATGPGGPAGQAPTGRSPVCRGRWARWFTGAFLVAWGAALVGPPLALLRWRESRLAALADPATQANWDVFRDDMRRQSGRDGPVQRKVPRSAEPPERVWLRDYVGLAITAWVTLMGVLGGFLGLTLRGLLSAPPSLPGERAAGVCDRLSARE